MIKSITLLPLLLALTGPLAGQTRTPVRPVAPNRPIRVSGVLARVNDQIITQRDLDKELGTRHLTNPELKGNPRRIEEEKFRILRRLTSRILLEQAIYSLQYEPDRIDAILTSIVEAEINRIRRQLGSMKAFLDHLKDRGQTINDLRREKRSDYRWQLFLQEKVDKPYTGREGLYRVRPTELLALYKAPFWKIHRERPAHTHLRLLTIPISPDLPAPQATSLAAGLVASLRSKGTGATLPEQVQARSFTLVDCSRAEKKDVQMTLGLLTGPGTALVVSGEEMAPPIRKFALGKPGSPKVSDPIRTGSSIQVVQVEKRVSRRTIAFTDPLMQSLLRNRIIAFKKRQAQMVLVQELWARSRIWPPKLKKVGPMQDGGFGGR